MKKIMMTRLSVCSLGVSCNEMIDTPMLLVVGVARIWEGGWQEFFVLLWTLVDPGLKILKNII